MWLQGSISTDHLGFLTPSKNLLVFIGGLFIELMEKDLGLIPKEYTSWGEIQNFKCD